MASSASVFPCTRTSVVNHVTTHSPPSTSVAPHSPKAMTSLWIWIWVWMWWKQRATSATLPTSHGYRRWHTAFNKIVMPMDIAPKIRPNASVLKQLRVLQSRLSRTVYLLRLRQSSSQKMKCFSMSQAWWTVTPITPPMELWGNSQDRNIFTRDILTFSSNLSLFNLWILSKHKTHKLLLGWCCIS